MYNLSVQNVYFNTFIERIKTNEIYHNYFYIIRIHTTLNNIDDNMKTPILLYHYDIFLPH